MANLFYDLFHAGAALMALAATLAFIATFLRRGANTPQKRWLRVASLVVAGGALAALLVVTSPLEYRTAAPIPRETTVYVVSMTNDLYALLATDGSRLFIRHLPEFQLQQILYREEGILIISDAGHGVPIQPSGTGYYLYANTNTLHALRADDGQEVMPSLGALGNVTTWLLDHGVLYVTNIDAPEVQRPADWRSIVSTRFSRTPRMTWREAWRSSPPATARWCGRSPLSPSACRGRIPARTAAHSTCSGAAPRPPEQHRARRYRRTSARSSLYA